MTSAFTTGRLRRLESTPNGGLDRWIRRVRRITTAGVLGLMLSSASATAEGIQVALMTDSSSILPGAEFEIAIDVTDSGSVFNSYDTIVVYDPAALTFLPASPLSLQEGPYMRAACGFTFQFFRSTSESLVISHSILCNELSLAGPGRLYKLRFRAAETPRTTHVIFQHLQFYNKGKYVNPVKSTNLTVAIELPPVGVDSRAWGDARAGVRLGLPRPNPSAGEAHIDFELSRESVIRLGIWDIRGARVAELASGIHAPGQYRAHWDGRMGSRPAPAGIYYVGLLSPAGSQVRRLVVSR